MAVTHLRCPDKPDAGPVCRASEIKHPDRRSAHDPSFVQPTCQACEQVARTPPCPVCGAVAHVTALHGVQWL